MSKNGLDRRAIFKNKESESKFLEPLFDILNRGESQAEIWVDLFKNSWSQDINNIYKSNIFRTFNGEE